MNVTRKLFHENKITPPGFVPESVQYETIMGSEAYGVSSNSSDVDIYGFCIPPKDYIFPHLAGYIHGFGTSPQSFDQYQQHHVKGDNAKEYDIQIYNIVKYFSLCMDNNPNMIDSLFTPENCVTASTKIGQMVRSERRIFLHKGAWHRFKGYAYSQMKKISDKKPVGKRAELVEKYGYDVKFAYHVIRLLDEVEQILMHGDIDLQQNREQLKSIRRGEWAYEDIVGHFSRKEKELESLYISSTVQKYPDEQRIKQLLLDCLEEYYGKLTGAEVRVPDKLENTLRQIKELTERAL